MDANTASMIMSRVAGLSSAHWTDDNLVSWTELLMTKDDAQIAELVLMRLVSANRSRPTPSEFENAYRTEMQPRLRAVATRTGATCDGSRFIWNDDDTVRPCPTCNPSLARRVDAGTHNEHTPPDEERAPLAPCQPAADRMAVMPPSAAIARMLAEGRRSDAERLAAFAGLSGADGAVRRRVEQILAARGDEPIDWNALPAPQFLKPAFGRSGAEMIRKSGPVVPPGTGDVEW